ncbi:MAG: 3-phosphoshikimate 1-carboxyvinyltransferase [Zetaproteobacteria bacterium CG_4_9_14_3_um_filter_49_83]|nr:MAG: 3-phosphoshikimate 1-carboxyvinyltransferase [Zetaproteobacteria bacterium CG1_02_49_23]PIQ33955.1 MAG: 3-phosphoshikimate 1-carboxyvinyltransferase [Zetaproteobacteria bacterium CG17_big_fil_post_rev_8_21_14_2_50_50_13]PIY56736.1 MAG: 3-phosphoshikimate 1-carboxyvinyltransferase [Zetaproteobacteria bacterium CG_4_10_14_0_8_um_filter_49_80]PJA35956.1 MAG: 3-phosphoshikimate 1-carboxyvinyltransferase [Zetaproteobacteria bacterium CG_4_9_14_3_um_filter_49_83]
MDIGGTLIAGPAQGPLSGELTIPGDKSMSHRSVMLASLADGITHIEGFLPGEDNLATVAMFEQMGAKVLWKNAEKTALQIEGVGLYGLTQPEQMLDAGNSGTCARLMLGILAGQSFSSTLTGDESLKNRPMKRVVDPMLRMGATIAGEQEGDCLPLTVKGGDLQGIAHVSAVASAQIKSCVLLAGLFAKGETTVQEPRPTRDHTERMMPLFGQEVEVDADGVIHLKPAGILTAPEKTVHIPADPSSAMFFAVAASLVKGSKISMKNIGMNVRRDGGFRILEQMQAGIQKQSQRHVGQEPVADVEIAYRPLSGTHVNPADVPDAIDEFPVLFAAAALSCGDFVLTEAEELRVKESDRIAVMSEALRSAGASIEESADGAKITGGRLKGGCVIDARGDHRIAMAMAVAAQCAEQPIEIRNAAAIATSFPDFVELAQGIGMNVAWLES